VSAPGCVVVLNGTSSSGKTTLLHRLQDRWDGPLVDGGLDRWLSMLPRRYVGPAWPEVFRYEHDAEGAITAVHPGPVGHRVVRAMHRAAAATARSGLDVVVDHVLLDPVWVRDLAAVLTGLPTLFVGVRLPLEVLVERERGRGDRTLGQAAAQYPVVHAPGGRDLAYDLTVDTAELDPDRAADAVLSGLAAGPAEARARLWGG
jgi:chloramphenicol 3-O phosphotransferase